MNEKKRTRGWCFTSFEDNPPMVPIGAQYMVYGKERCPTSGNMHYQGFVYYRQPISFRNVKSQLGENVHIEASKGTVDQNVRYCTKEDAEPYVWGVKPEQGKRSDLHGLSEAVQSGRLLEEIASDFGTQLIKYPRGVKFLRELYLRKMKFVGERRVVYLWGEPGSGKTRRAIQLGVETGGYYIADLAPAWFDGYDGESTIILDDFCFSDWKRTTLLRFLDRYEVLLPVKGGSVPSCYNTVVITSNEPPPRHDQAVMRRISEIYEMY